MRDFKPLSESEYKVIAAVQKELEKDNSIQCTACKYCVSGCPMDIAIPGIFAVKNKETGNWDGGRGAYQIATEGRGKASDCIECGQCEDACPQHLPIISLLKDCANLE
jgi:predicted aldo/keto reductase-like oxidoreductase